MCVCVVRECVSQSLAPLLTPLPHCYYSCRQELLGLTEIAHYKNGEAIVTQGAKGHRFYIILDGAARVVEDDEAAGPAGNAQGAELALLRSGHCFGEMALVTNAPRVANVLSVGATTCLSLTKEVFQKEFR